MRYPKPGYPGCYGWVGWLEQQCTDFPIEYEVDILRNTLTIWSTFKNVNVPEGHKGHLEFELKSRWCPHIIKFKDYENVYNWRTGKKEK